MPCLNSEARPKRPGASALLELIIYNYNIEYVGVCCSKSTLPRELATQEVEQHVSDGAKIISSTRLAAIVQVHLTRIQLSTFLFLKRKEKQRRCGVARGARHATLLRLRDVSLRVRVDVMLGKAEVDDVDLVFVAFRPQHKIAGLDVLAGAA